MRRRFLTALSASVISALALTGCSPSQTPDDFDRTPEQADTALEAADASDLQLPLIVEPLELVEPGWDLGAQHFGDAFLSADIGQDRLEFTAVDTHGSLLWRAQRPTGCTGFTVTVDDEDEPLAVLTDSASSQDCETDVTASAYDLETGQQRWGPVDVPGPLRGPGTVFSPAQGAPAEAIALDPSTGEAVESGDSKGSGDANGSGESQGSGESHIIGEYHGTILSADEGTLRATEDAHTVWEHSLPDNDWTVDGLRAFPGAAHGEGFIHLDAGDGAGPVFDTATGDILDDDARGVARDGNTEAIVTLGAHGLTVIDDLGKSELPISVPDSVRLEAAVGGLIYLREGGTLRVHNATTGSIARGYRADGSGIVAVPDVFTAEGLGTLRAGDRTLLATDRVVEDSAES